MRGAKCSQQRHLQHTMKGHGPLAAESPMWGKLFVSPEMMTIFFILDGDAKQAAKAYLHDQ